MGKRLSKPIVQDGLTNRRRKANQLGDVVNGEQRIGQQLLSMDQVTQVGPGKVLTGIAGTIGVDRREVSAEAIIFEVPAIAFGQGRTMASQSRWNHTVEQVYASCDRLSHFSISAHPHQVARLIRRQ